MRVNQTVAVSPEAGRPGFSGGRTSGDRRSQFLLTDFGVGGAGGRFFHRLGGQPAEDEGLRRGLFIRPRPLRPVQPNPM
jgi:hypothetical protein